MDYQERTQIAAIRSGIGMLGSLLVVLLTWNFIMVATDELPTPQLSREPYFEFALLTALVMGALMLVCSIGTLSIVPMLSNAHAEHPGFNFRRVYADIYDALRNKAFFALFWGSLIFAVYIGVHGSLAMHTKTFFWQLDTKGIEYIQYAGVVGGLLGLVLIGTFHRIFDKRVTLINGVFVYCVMATGPIALQLFGWMPTDPPVLRWTLAATQVLGYAGIIHAGVSGVSMMGDIADEHELEHGRRQEGVYFGSHNFAMKCTTAVGTLIAGFALDLVSFPVDAVPGEVSEQVLFDYGLFNVGLVFMAGIGVWVFWPYNMSRRRHDEIQQGLLAARNSA